jgi:hypothetical protein
MNADKFFVFDVESAGLHGEGFAVGFVVVDREGNKRDEGLFVAPVNSAVEGKSSANDHNPRKSMAGACCVLEEMDGMAGAESGHGG